MLTVLYTDMYHHHEHWHMYCLNMLGMLPHSACAVYWQQRKSSLIGCVTGRECMHEIEAGLHKGWLTDLQLLEVCAGRWAGLIRGFGARLCGRSSLTLVLSFRSALALASCSPLLCWRLLLGCCIPLLRCICRPGRQILECCSYDGLKFISFLGLRQDSCLFRSL